jgi:tetratricopeptide (TPR) repeat protein
LNPVFSTGLQLGDTTMWRSVLVLAVLVTASLVQAQDISPWVGQRVVTKVLTPLKVGNRIVDEGTMFRVYTVERAHGDWLWLVSGGVSGWVQSSEVVPYDQASEYFTLEIRTNPTSAYLYVIRGMHWIEKGETDKAIADFNEAIRLDPNDPVAFFNRGNAWSAKKESEKALEDYNDAIRLDPRFAGVFFSRGKTWQNKQEQGKALADYGEVIRRNPKFSLAFNNRGNAWSAKKEYLKAIADYAEAIRLDPKFALAFTNRAWLLATCPDASLRDGKKAVETAIRACELSEWKAAFAISTLAAAYAEAGDFDKAVLFQDKVNALYSDPKDRQEGDELLRL